MHQLRHMGLQASAGQFARQFYMRLVESGWRAMQDSNQVHHGLMAGHRLRQRGLVVHIEFQHGQTG